MVEAEVSEVEIAGYFGHTAGVGTKGFIEVANEKEGFVGKLTFGQK
jgi:hypothetical protein